MVLIATSLKKRLIITLGMGLTAFCIATPAKAFELTYQGDTTNQPTWLRTAPGDPPDRVSGSDGGPGMNPAYDVFEFVVEQSGLYSFASAVPGATSSNDGAWDNFLVLYQDSFNPNDQLTNALISINAPNNGSSAFNQQLNAGENYFLGDCVQDFS
jgi:hypothetical protein